MVSLADHELINTNFSLPKKNDLLTLKENMSFV